MDWVDGVDDPNLDSESDKGDDDVGMLRHLLCVEFVVIGLDVAVAAPASADGGGNLHEQRGRGMELGHEGEDAVVFERLERNRERSLLRWLLIRQISMSVMVMRMRMKKGIALLSLQSLQVAIPVSIMAEVKDAMSRWRLGLGTYLDKLLDAHGTTSGVPMLENQEWYSRHSQTMSGGIRSPDLGITFITIEPLSRHCPRWEQTKQHGLVGQEIFIGEMLSVEMMSFE